MTKTSLITLSAIFFVNHLSAQLTARVDVNAANPKIVISRNIYGHFSEHLGRCIYDGFWVNDSVKVPKKDRIRMDVVEALKKIKIPVLRWPGGCFADEYHWRDGIGARNQRPKMVNTNWGGVVEDNSFGTNEFLELCSLLGCEPYISANIGSGTVEEMSKWVEYVNFDGESPMANERKKNGHPQPYNVHFWGIGNEAWGCGGEMTAEYYADVFRRYASYAKNYPNSRLRKVASGANSSDYHWTETLMKNIPLNLMWGTGLHYYTVPTGNWRKKGSATNFDEKEYFGTMRNCLKMEELVSRHCAIMDKYDTAKRVALAVDEWGIWTDVEPGTNPAFLYQQNSLRDGLLAATTLNIFNNHADRVRLANLAQTVNVLQALVLTRGSQMLVTPTYHVFDLYKVHQDAKLLPIQITSPDYTSGTEKIPAVNASASLDSTGAIHISLVNLDPNNKITVRAAMNGSNWKTVDGLVLTSAKVTDINTFEKADTVKPAKFSAAKKDGNELVVELPAKSVVVLELK